MGVPSCLRRNPTPVRRENLSHEKRWSKICWNRRTNKLNQSRYLFYVFKLFLIKYYTNLYYRKIKYDLLSSSLSDLKVIRFIRETIIDKAWHWNAYFTFPPFSNSPAACYYYIPLSLSLSTDICIAMCQQRTELLTLDSCVMQKDYQNIKPVRLVFRSSKHCR